MPTTIQVTLTQVEKICRDRGILPGGRAQKILANEVYRQAAPYTPFRTGSLTRNVSIAQDGRSITYLSPYARYLYFGKVMAGKAPKQVTGKNLSFQGAPQRGAFWIPRMMAERGQEIGKIVADAAGGSYRK